jgi:type III pantothenate kinase
MLIAVDIGNSSINIGYFADSGLIVQKLATRPKRRSEQYAAVVDDFLAHNKIEKKGFGVIISSVVSSHTAAVAKALRRLSPAGKSDITIVTYDMQSGLNLAIDAPAELGTDRLSNAVAAFEFYGAPVAVLDFGTATVVTVVDRNANCIGGAILPGLGLMSDILARGTSKLERVAMKAPGSALGRDTGGCIRSGIFFGTAGAVERILSEIEAESSSSFAVVVTGGYGGLVAKFMRRPHELRPNLVLDGLKILYEKNRRS